MAPTSKGFGKSIGSSAVGAQLINAVIEVSINRSLDSKIIYSTKRAGSAANASTPTATGLLVVKHNSSRFSNIYTGGSGTVSLYSDATNIGTLTGHLSTVSNYQACDAISSNVGILGFVTSDGAGWILYEDAISTNFPTFTGNRTSGSAVISGIASTTGIYKGQAITGDGIPASTRVTSVDSATQITMSANATSGAGTATTITKEAVSKITTTDFPSATNMEQIDGYFVVGTASGTIRHSGLNDPFTWTTTFTISSDLASDNLVCIFRHGEFICAAGSVGTIQYFYNAGNPAGSVLSAANQLDIIGISCKHRPAQHATGLYFIGSEKNESGQVSSLYRLNGTNSIEQASSDLWSSIITDTSLSFVSPITNGNKSLLAVHSSAAATFPVYDPSINDFTEFELGAALTSAFRRTFTVSGTSTAIDWAVSDIWTDSGASYTYTAITEPQGPFGDFGATDVFIDLIADKEASGVASLSVSDDFHATWSSRGDFDMTSNLKRIWRCGFHRGRRAYKVQHSANTGFRAQLLNVNMEV